MEAQEFIAFIEKISNYDLGNTPTKGLNILCKNLRFKKISTSIIYQAGQKMKNVSVRKNSKNAILAKTSLGYAFSRVFQVGTDLQGIDKTEIFKDQQLQQALQWLDLEDMTLNLETIIEQYEKEG